MRFKWAILFLLTAAVFIKAPHVFAQQQLEELTVNADQCINGMVMHDGLCEDPTPSDPPIDPNDYTTPFVYPYGGSGSDYVAPIAPYLETMIWPVVLRLLERAGIVAAGLFSDIEFTMLAEAALQSALDNVAVQITRGSITISLFLMQPTASGVVGFTIQVIRDGITRTVISANHPLYNRLIPLINNWVSSRLGPGGGDGQLEY